MSSVLLRGVHRPPKSHPDKEHSFSPIGCYRDLDGPVLHAKLALPFTKIHVSASAFIVLMTEQFYTRARICFVLGRRACEAVRSLLSRTAARSKLIGRQLYPERCEDQRTSSALCHAIVAFCPLEDACLAPNLVDDARTLTYTPVTHSLVSTCM